MGRQSPKKRAHSTRVPGPAPIRATRGNMRKKKPRAALNCGAREKAGTGTRFNDRKKAQRKNPEPKTKSRALGWEKKPGQTTEETLGRNRRT